MTQQDPRIMPQRELVQVIIEMVDSYSELGTKYDVLYERNKALDMKHAFTCQLLIETQRSMDLDIFTDGQGAVYNIRDEINRREAETTQFVEKLDAATQRIYHLEMQLEALKYQNSDHIKTHRALRAVNNQGAFHAQA